MRFLLRGGLSRRERPRPFCRLLGDGVGPLDFRGEQDALSLAVGSRDGLQLQEVQQHLDLPGTAGGGGSSEGRSQRRREVLLTKARGVVTEALRPARGAEGSYGAMSPSQQDTGVPLRDHPKKPRKVQREEASLGGSLSGHLLCTI